MNGYRGGYVYVNPTYKVARIENAVDVNEFYSFSELHPILYELKFGVHGFGKSRYFEELIKRRNSELYKLIVRRNVTNFIMYREK